MKKLLALLLSIVLLLTVMPFGAVNATSGSVSEFTAEENELSLLDPTQPNSQSNPYIIANANQMYCLMIGDSTNAGEKIDTTGKFFKVADGIDAFYMNGGATVAAFTTPAQVKEYFTVTNTSAKKVLSGSARAFKGTFDGNGVTIYGIRSDDSNAGLFPFVDGDATIKNVTVKNSYLVGATGGGLVGNVLRSAAPNSITAENCQIINNYISASRGDCGAGGLFGFLYSLNATDGYPEIHVNNCIVAGNELIAASASAPGAFSFAGTFGGNKPHKIKNSIFLGGDHIFNVGSWWAKQPNFYENVFTDADLSTANQTYVEGTIEKVTADDLKGENGLKKLNAFDFASVWFASEGDLPTLRVFHDLVATDNGDGTHSENCDCGLVGVKTVHTIENDSCIICGLRCQHVASDIVEENRVEATCTANGYYDTIVYCSECGGELSRNTVIIPATGHTFGEVVPYVAPTCQTEGNLAYKHCITCGHTLEADADINSTMYIYEVVLGKLPHPFDADGDCTACGYNPFVQYLSYKIANGAVTITGCDQSFTGEMIIPRTIEGYTVKIIAIGAFENCASMTSVKIPNGVMIVDNSSFYGCTSLTSITIPDSITSIGRDAFYYCTSLTSITIGGSVTSIGEAAFSGCTSLKSVYINSLDTWFNIYFYDSHSNPLIGGADLYVNGEKLVDLVIPHYVSYIKSYVFNGCLSLESVTIHNGVYAIREYAFNNCDNIMQINYYGTQDEWNAITKGVYNYPLYLATLNLIECENHVYDGISDKVCNVCAKERTYVPGDLAGNYEGGDGEINNKDLGVLMQYLNGWNYTNIVLEAADVNGDGAVNNRDYGILMRYINGWDIELK